MSVSLITPQFAPNLYDLASMLKAEQVIWLDIEPWSRKGRTHRAELRNAEGTQWINIPILSEDKKKPIQEVRIDHSEPWLEAFWNGILHNYQHATWFDFFEDELFSDIQYARECEFLFEFNAYFFQRLCTYMELDINMTLASKLPTYDSNPEQAAVNLGADEFYIEHQSKNYLWQSDKALVALQRHPKYRQAHPGFIEGCSILDLLLNEGKESYKVLSALFS